MTAIYMADPPYVQKQEGGCSDERPLSLLNRIVGANSVRVSSCRHLVPEWVKKGEKGDKGDKGEESEKSAVSAFFCQIKEDRSLIMSNTGRKGKMPAVT